MNRVSRVLDAAQQLGSRIGAYKNVGWLALLLAGAGVVAFRYAVGMGEFLLAGVSALSVTAVLLPAVLVLYRRLSGPAYRWTTAEYVYRFDAADLRRQTQLIKVRIRARRNNVCCFENSYFWSGTGDSKVRVVSPGHRFVGEAPDDDSKKRYWVHLDSPLSRGEEAEIHVEQDLFDDRRSLRPILAKRVSEPLDALVLRAVFPRVAAPAQVSARQTAYSEKARHWREVQRDDPKWQGEGSEMQISYSPARPKVGRRYEIKWDPWDIYNQSDITP